MRVKALVAFRSKLFRPCRKLLLIFRFKLRKPLFIKALRFRSHPKKPKKAPPRKRIFSSLLPNFHSLKQSRKMDRLGELRSVSEAEHERMLLPSPLTPAYLKVSSANKREPFFNEEVEDACRSFENYLAQMIVEEGKVRDLMDVEELLYCWKNLKCPVFIDLVCRFYGELCKDLFSPEDDNSKVDSPN